MVGATLHPQTKAFLQKRDNSAHTGGTSSNLSNRALLESDLEDFKPEVELQVRPFACGVSGCQKRYKSKSGLKYHYLHAEHRHGVVRI